MSIYLKEQYKPVSYSAAIVSWLKDSNLVAKYIGPVHGVTVASPEYIRAHGAPTTPDELLGHQALMQGMEPWF